MTSMDGKIRPHPQRMKDEPILDSLEGYECFDDNRDGQADYCGRDSDNSGYFEEV